eukprot:gene23678-29923_t
MDVSQLREYFGINVHEDFVIHTSRIIDVQDLQTSKAKMLAKLEQAVKIKAVTRERFLLEQAKKEKEAPKLSAADEDLNSKLMASDKDKDKDLTAKDRVKRQRLAGQSGIGEDFKSWKSEEEMRQRQHYD